MRLRLPALLPLVCIAAAALAACGPATPEVVEPAPAERPAPTTPAEAALYEAQDAIEADFASFAVHGEPFQSEGHEAWLTVHRNEVAAQGPGPDGGYPPGSVFAAVERPASGAQPARIAVLSKLPDEGGQWLYSALAPDGTVLLSGTAQDKAVADACANCHTIAAAGTDAIFTAPPAQ